MRKLLLAFCVLSAAALLPAELYKPNRFVEFGVQANAGASNNYFSLPDYLQKEVVLDLRKIANELPENGWNLEALVTTRSYFQMNFGQRFRLEFFSTVEGSGAINVASDLFDLLGKGYSVGETVDCDIHGYGDIFASVGASFATRYRGFGIKVTPAYVIPIAYVADAKANVTFKNTESGVIKAEARVPVDIYTVVDAESAQDGGVGATSATEALLCGGFDLALAVEYPLLRTLDVGAFTRVPLVPGRLNYKMTANMYAYYQQTNLLGYLDNSDESASGSGVDDIVYSEETYYAHRPFRIGVEAAWRPFGRWMVFRPELALAMRNPYSSALQVYMEYSLSAEFSLFNIFAIQAATAYQNRVFVQSLGIMLNTRLVEIDIGIALRGADFTNSFRYTGFGASAGLKVGL